LDKPSLNGSLASKKNHSPVAKPKDNYKKFLNIVRNNLFPIILIILACTAITIFYIFKAKDIYISTTTIKISRPQGSVLSSNIIPEFQDFITDRFISNEIEVLKSYRIREAVAEALLDSFKVDNDPSKYYYIFNQLSGTFKLQPSSVIAETFSTIVKVNQKRGLDVVDIVVEDPSNYEAMLIANLYSTVYLDYSRDLAKEELITLTKYLDEERENKFKDLAIAESALEDFQTRGGIVLLESQVANLVDNISTLEAQKNLASIELISSERGYSSLRSEIERIDPTLIDYLEGKVSEPYITQLQTQIAELETKRDIEASIPQEERLKEKTLNEYNRKISPLKETLEEKIEILKRSLFSSTPQERREIAQKLIETNVNLQTNTAKYNTLTGLLSRYEEKFSKLPSQSIEYAKLERNRKSTEKLFLILEEKYQEAKINERIKLGNVLIIDPAVIAMKPSKPNRPLILILGVILGVLLGLGYAYGRNYLDRTIKSPEEIENHGVSILAWIPSIDELKGVRSSQVEFIVANKANAPASESFKALRTRVQYAKLEEKPLKTILVTSSIPGEGKTTVSLNLAGSFALANKKVLLLDCDLRKPRVHSVFEVNRYPGLSDYLFSNASLDEITRDTRLENMKIITSGTIPPNPSELLASKQLSDFFEKLKDEYDIIIIDSPPFVSVTDAEILFRTTDGTVLVVQAGKTPSDIFFRSCERLTALNPHNFLGVVLNNFNYKTVYGYYYNYYYYYSKPEEKLTKPLPKVHDRA
jgi:capsular exopolysaccharide synthesis family protein